MRKLSALSPQLSVVVVSAFRRTCLGPANQPPLKLRRSAEALAKAEAGHYSLSISAGMSALLASWIAFASAQAPAPTSPQFVESAAAVGLGFTHVSGASGQYYMPEQMGAGSALFDYDGDGDLDVFLVQSGSLTGGAKPGSDEATSRLFRNDLSAGKLHFTDVTARAGVGLRAYGMGAATGDYDSDGNLDLLVTSFGPKTLFRNNGDGTFTDVTKESRVGDALWSASAAFADYDRDGDLDLFVANYLDFTLAANKVCNDSLGARDYCSPRAYSRSPTGCIATMAAAGSPTSPRRQASRSRRRRIGRLTGDYNGDGWLDFYVANDATPNQLWINQKNGTFKDDGLLSGAALNAAGNPEGSMGIASGDFDLDGDEDLFITNIVGETFALYVNDGRGAFDDARAKAGLAARTAAFTGFGTDWFDYDNDGWLDLFIANGAVNIVEAQRGEKFPFRMKNQLFRNTGAGRFEETSKAGGPAFDRAEIGRGAAFGDIDNDGDVDVLVTNNNGPARLLLNQGRTKNHWLQLRLQQAQGNRFGFGAWIGVERPGQATIWRRVRSDGSYLSANDSRVHVGLGSATQVTGVTVQWPDGARERWTSAAVDRLVTLQRGTGK